MILAKTLTRAYPPVPAETNPFTEQLAMLAEDQMSKLRMIASTTTMNIIKDAVAIDDQYARLRTQIAVGWPDRSGELTTDLREFRSFADELTVCDDLIFNRNTAHDCRWGAPSDAERVHSSHIGTNGCIRRAREVIFYPGMVADIKALIERCEICPEYDAANQKEALFSHAIPSRPWEKVGVDIFTFSDKNYLITVDYFSNYFEIDRLPSKIIFDIVYILKQQFARHSIPSVVFSDNSPFNSQEFRKFAELYEFEHQTSSPRYLQSNGKTET